MWLITYAFNRETGSTIRNVLSHTPAWNWLKTNRQRQHIAVINERYLSKTEQEEWLSAGLSFGTPQDAGATP